MNVSKKITNKTYEWVMKLESAREKVINEKDFKKLEKEYFRGCKKDWYTEIITVDNESFIEWDKDKCKTFWSLLRDYCMTKGEKRYIYHFSGYIFPSFDGETFFSFSSKREFKFPVVFIHSHFLDVFHIDKISFSSKVTFLNSIFYSDSVFRNINYSGNINFHTCVFQGKLDFEENIFSNNKTLIFKEVNFKEDVFFGKVEFLNETAFRDCIFFKEFNILNSVIEKKMFFINSSFQDHALFINVRETPKLIFDNCYKRRDESLATETIFKEIDTLKEYYYYSNHDFSVEGFIKYYRCLSDLEKNKYPNFLKKQYKYQNEILSKVFLKEDRIKDIDIYFKGISLNNSIFRRMDMRKVIFYDVFFYNTVFEKCIWGFSKGNSRLKLHEEEGIIKSNRRFSWLEEQYRQLKKNFENSKDWELTSKAYRSEMEMRYLHLKKGYKLFDLKSNVSLLIFCIYKYFGGYLQSYVRPLCFLLLSTLIIFPLIYAWTNNSEELIFELYNGKPFKMSIDAAIPFFKFDYENNWSAYRIQSIISITLISFFILALRKRFK